MHSQGVQNTSSTTRVSCWRKHNTVASHRYQFSALNLLIEALNRRTSASKCPSIAEWLWAPVAFSAGIIPIPELFADRFSISIFCLQSPLHDNCKVFSVLIISIANELYDYTSNARNRSSSQLAATTSVVRSFAPSSTASHVSHHHVNVAHVQRYADVSIH